MSCALYVMLLGALLAICSGHTVKMGGCPRIKVLETFDFDQFLGDWYVMQRFNPIATCTKISIEKAKNKEGAYTVSETSRLFGINFRSENRPRTPRKLSFPKPDTKSVFKVQRTLGPLTLRTFGVVDTDYDNTAVVFGCDPLLFGSILNGDILSRKLDADPEAIKRGRTALEGMGVDIRPLMDVDQSRCGDRTAIEEDKDFTVIGRNFKTDNSKEMVERLVEQE